MPRSSFRFLLVPLFLFGSSAALHATSYVMVHDGDLADRADAVALVRVAGVETAPVAGMPATDVLVEVERLVQGSVPGSSILVRVPGGARGNVGFKIWGAPEFRPGDRALLFLVAQSDGTYRILHLMLGAFREVPGNGRTIAVRDLSGASEAALPGRPGDPSLWHQPRDLERFAAWIADRAAGRRREPDYFVASSGVQADFTFLTDEGLRVRWFEFDEGRSISWRSSSAGQPGLSGGGHAELQHGIAAWNADGATNIDYAYAGQTSVTGGLDQQDGTNSLLFEQSLPDVDPFDCASGGVLAIGGPWTDQEVRGTYKGETFLRALEADVATNQNVACFFQRSSSPNLAADELFTHELGHTLGLGHSCGDSRSGACDTAAKDEAVMRAFVHDDGRGARLGSDDRAGIATLYLAGGGGGGGAPKAPAALGATLDGLAAVLSWQDRSTNEQGFRVYRGVAGGALSLLATLSAATTSYRDAPLASGTRYDYEVAAFNNQGESGHSNRAAVTTPSVQPVTVALQPIPAATTGQVAHFEATTTGPVVRATWDLGAVARAFSNGFCQPARVCAEHLYDIPGTYPVRVTVFGDAGQTAEATGAIVVGGAPVSLPGEDSFLQSLIFGPRGATGVFKSDLWLHNAGEADARVGLVYLPRGAGNPNPARREVTLPPDTSLFLPNLLGGLFGETSSQGSLGLEIRRPLGAVSGPSVFTFVRSYLEVGGGSFGQLVPEETQATWSADAKVVAGILEGAGFASTILAANLDGVPGQVDVELRDALGLAVGTSASFSLGARTMRFQPIANLFPEAANRPGPFTARFTSTGIRFAGSATLLETGSQDQIFLPAVPPPPAEGSLDPQVSEGEFLIPRFVRNRGQFGTTLASKLVLWNPTDQPRDLTLSFWLRGQNNSAPPTVVRTLPANTAILFDDAVRDLFGLEEATGALRILWRGPTGLGPRVLSLGFATTGGATPQRFGMLVDARRPSLEGSRHAVDFGAEQTAVSRSSYGIVNLNGAQTTVRVTLENEAGTKLHETTLILKARQHLERTLLGIFPGLANGSNWHVTTEVLTGGDVLTYLANINATGDVFYVPGRPLD